MNILASFKLGFKAAIRNKPLLIFLWTTHSFLALLFVLPSFFLFRHHFSHSFLAEGLAGGANLVSMGDLIYNYQNLMPLLLAQIIALFLLGIIVSVATTAGIFGAFGGETKYRFPEIVAAAGRYFFRFSAVFLLFLLSLLVILIPFSRSLASLFQAWTKEAKSAWPAFWTGWVRIGLLLILYSLLKMFFDFTKARLVQGTSRRVLSSVGQCASFLSRRFWRAWAVFLFSSSVSTGVILVFFFLFRLIPTASLWTFWAVFGLQQLYVFLRGAAKVLTLGACYYFLRLESETP